MSGQFDEVTTRAIGELPEGLQTNVVHWLERLGPTKLAQANAALSPLLKLVACSEFAAAVLLFD